MKTSLGLLAAAALGFAAALLITGRLNEWQTRAARAFVWAPVDEQKLRRAEADREAREARAAQHRAQREADELQEQRRERLTLLTATLGVRPIRRLVPAEQQLFQEAQRDRTAPLSESEQRRVIHMIEPVQIDEWTVLQAGTPVEFVRYDRDNLITVRHEGAMYQVDPLQTDTR